MWLTKIFEREFGFSDVQSNYSRVYAWMANQLGHVTLGLITVLLFVWIAETVETFAAALIAAGGWLAALTASGAASGVPGASTGLSTFLLSIAMIAILIGALVIAGMGVKPNPAAQAAWREDGADLRRRYPAMGPSARRAQVFIALIGGGALVWFNLPEMIEPEALRRAGVSVAVAFTGLALATLCRDWRFALIGALSLFALWQIAIPGGGISDPWLRHGLIGGAAVLFLWVSNVVLIGFASPAERYGVAEGLLQIATNISILAVLLIADAVLTSAEWRLAFAGFVASLTIWWMKEFASDLPNVHQEIRAAARQRPPEILGDCSSVELDYFTDARMDARTDGLFYLAGAWIGAGTASSLPVLDDAPWRSGSEILGLIVFVVIFLAVGRTWAYRQLALDRVGAIRAGRLGVFHAGLVLKTLVLDKAGHLSAPPTSQRVEDPLTALSCYADDVALSCGETDEARRAAKEALNPCRHLILFGAPGSGRGPLGRAIASEAAVADFPTLFRRQKRPKCRAGQERTARYISADRLLTHLGAIKTLQDAAEAPTAPIAFADGQRIARGQKPPTSGEVIAEPAASTVVIDDLTLTDVSGQRLDALLANLDLDPARREGGQKTVWLIDIEDQGAATDTDWDTCLMKAATRVAPLLRALAAVSPGDDHRHVGVGLVRRTEAGTEAINPA